MTIMKRIVFYTSIVISTLILVELIKIMLIDLNRLTDYGFGYLAGRAILFLVFLTIALYARKYKTEPNSDVC